MISTNAAGVAVCSCGAELEIRCTGGCPEPDFVLEENYLAARPPRQCNYPGCEDDAYIRPPGGRGRPSTLCPAHKALRKKYRDTWKSKKNGASTGAVV